MIFESIQNNHLKSHLHPKNLHQVEFINYENGSLVHQSLRRMLFLANSSVIYDCLYDLNLHFSNLPESATKQLRYELGEENFTFVNELYLNFLKKLLRTYSK